MTRLFAFVVLWVAAVQVMAHDIPQCPAGQTLVWNRMGPPEFPSHADLCASYGKIPYHDDGLGGWGFGCKNASDPPSAIGGVGIECKVWNGGPVAPVCPGNVTKTMNLTLGYYGSPTADGVPDYAPDGSPMTQAKWDGQMATLGGQICINSCPWNVTGANDAWQSLQPTNNGLYRASANFTFQSVSSDTPCTASDSEKSMGDAGYSPPACSGTEGYINGKKVCVPKDASSTNVVPATPPGNVSAGNPTAGSEGKLSDIPLEGPGQPGGNAGGPPHPKDGTVTTPTGIEITPTPSEPESGTTTDAPGEEQKACGAPGQDPCKIDERGTPNGQGVFNTANGQVDAKQTEALNAIEGHKNIQAPQWTWTFQLPSGCTALTLEAFDLSIDVCQWQPMIHNIMGILWCMAAAFLCMRMVFNTIGD